MGDYPPVFHRGFRMSHYAKGSPKMFNGGYNDCPNCGNHCAYMISKNNLKSVVCSYCGRVYPMGTMSFRYALRKWNSRDFNPSNYSVCRLGMEFFMSHTDDAKPVFFQLSDGNRYDDPKFSDMAVLTVNRVRIILNDKTVGYMADWLERWKLYHEDRMNNQNRKEW